jgi:formate dehydrogenase major subunit
MPPDRSIDHDKFRVPNIGLTVQKNAVDSGVVKQFPLILTSGRMVEYEGGGEETRSNKWLAELKQEMYVEINPVDALERGVKDGGWVWVYGPENSFQDADEGAGDRAGRQGPRMDAVPLRGLVRGRGSARQISAWQRSDRARQSVNTLTTYGYDPATGMQEPKATLCQIRAV